MIDRYPNIDRLNRLFRDFPVVALIGARQVGKSTLARAFAAAQPPGAWFDLESHLDVARLESPLQALAPLTGLVVFDEIQRRPDLFDSLRVLADRPGRPASFLVLGSASPELSLDERLNEKRQEVDEEEGLDPTRALQVDGHYFKDGLHLLVSLLERRLALVGKQSVANR